MTDDVFSVKVNRQEGIIEITGSDKEWIAEQLDRLAVVFEPNPTAKQAASGLTDKGGGTSSGNSSSPTQNDDGGEQVTRRRARGGGGGSSFKQNEDLAEKLTPEVRAGLDAFVEERRGHFTEAPNQAAILAEFLHTDLGFDAVGANDLYTVYNVMGWRAPNPRNALDNGKTRKNYFTSSAKGLYRLSHTGETFARHDAKRPVEKK